MTILRRRALPLFILVFAVACGTTTEDPQVVCETDEDCAGQTTPYCDQAMGECVECTRPDHCTAGETCRNFSCVLEGCLEDEDCEEDEVCEEFVCVPRDPEDGCQDDDDCTGPALGICDSDQGECVECLENHQCGEDMICSDRACEIFEMPEGWYLLDSEPAEELNLRSVACKSDRVWAVGEGGTILHSENGHDFYRQSASSSSDFASVSFIDDRNGVLVGGVEILETSDGGETWSPAWFCAVIAMSEYNEVIMVSEGTGYAIGQSRDDEGTFKYRIPQGWNCFTGQTWPTYSLLTGAFTGETRGFMTGDTGGNVLKTQDMWSWETIDTGFAHVFHGMSFRGNLSGWIVGEEGIVLRTDDGGDSWRRLAEGLTNETLRSVAVMNESVVVAVGDSGTILESSDGGENFALTNYEEPRRLEDVCFLDDIAYVAGEAGLLMKARF